MSWDKLEYVNIVPIEIGDRIYGFEVSDVREILATPEITTVPFAPHWVEGLANVRGEIVTVISLPARLGDTVASPQTVSQAPQLVMVAGAHRTSFGVLVQRVGSVRTVGDDQLTPAQHVCERGRVLLDQISLGIVNPAALIQP